MNVKKVIQLNSKKSYTKINNSNYYIYYYFLIIF